MDAPGQQKITIIAHRGASGLRPEHTRGAYELAVAQGADFIEPDLVLSQDGYLVVRHENELGGTTDVSQHSEFADRKTTKVIDGVSVEGWFSEDFALAELKTLRAKERIPDVRPQNTEYDGQYEILTLSEVIELTRELEQKHQRPIGIYPETKHPTYFLHEGTYLDSSPIGVCISSKLVDTLVEYDFTDPQRIFIQSFEVENLLRLKHDLMPARNIDLPLVQLIGDLDKTKEYPAKSFAQPYDMVFRVNEGADLSQIYGDLDKLVAGGVSADVGYADLVEAPVLSYISKTYASGLGPWKNSLFDDGSDTANPFLKSAIDAGLIIHPYTLRKEAAFRPTGANGAKLEIEDEMRRLVDAGVHGFFTDDPDIGSRVRDNTH